MKLPLNYKETPISKREGRENCEIRKTNKRKVKKDILESQYDKPNQTNLTQNYRETPRSKREVKENFEIWNTNKRKVD